MRSSSYKRLKVFLLLRKNLCVNYLGFGDGSGIDPKDGSQIRRSLHAIGGM
jgi:hypothetical protein